MSSFSGRDLAQTCRRKSEARNRRLSRQVRERGLDVTMLMPVSAQGARAPGGGVTRGAAMDPDDA